MRTSPNNWSSNYFTSPQVLILTAGIIGMMGMIPGMPHFAFLLLAGLLGWFAYFILRRAKRELEQPVVETVAAPPVRGTGSQLGRCVTG
jgi:flagellar biosynthesis protein FlhA